jgi:membrane protein implicated in regulation of membrane protease activity
MLERLHKRAFHLFFIGAMAFCVSMFWVGDADLPFIPKTLGFVTLLALAALLGLTIAKMLRDEG